MKRRIKRKSWGGGRGIEEVQEKRWRRGKAEEEQEKKRNRGRGEEIEEKRRRKKLKNLDFHLQHRLTTWQPVTFSIRTASISMTGVS